MLVFGGQCPNSDTDSGGESRDTLRVVPKRRLALTVFPADHYYRETPKRTAVPLANRVSRSASFAVADSKAASDALAGA